MVQVTFCKNWQNLIFFFFAVKMQKVAVISICRVSKSFHLSFTNVTKFLFILQVGFKNWSHFQPSLYIDFIIMVPRHSDTTIMTLALMTLNNITLKITTLGIMALGLTKISLMKLSIMRLNKMRLTDELNGTQDCSFNNTHHHCWVSFCWFFILRVILLVLKNQQNDTQQCWLLNCDTQHTICHCYIEWWWVLLQLLSWVPFNWMSLCWMSWRPSYRIVLNTF